MKSITESITLISLWFGGVLGYLGIALGIPIGIGPGPIGPLNSFVAPNVQLQQAPEAAITILGDALSKQSEESYRGVIINLSAVIPGDCEKIVLAVTGARLGEIAAIGIPRNLMDENNALFGQPSVIASDLVEFKRCNVSDPLHGRALKAWRDQLIYVDVWKPHN